MSPKDVVGGGGDGAAPWPRIEASTLIFRGVEGASRSSLILGPSCSTFGSTLVVRGEEVDSRSFLILGPGSSIFGSTLVFRGIEGDSRSFLILGPGSSTFGSTLTFDSFLAFAWAVVSSFGRVGPLCGICSRFDVDRALLLAFLDGPCSSRRSAFVPGLAFVAL